MENNKNGNNALIAEIRKLKRQIENNDFFEFRDVKDYLGENIDRGVIEPVLYYDGEYYNRSDKAGVLTVMKLNGDIVKRGTFRNWVEGTAPKYEPKPEKLADHKVSYEYMANFTYDGKPTTKYITTRGDVLNRNLSIMKYPRDKTEFTLVINGRHEVLHRAYLVVAYFVDEGIDNMSNPMNEIYFVNGSYDDCDISNLLLKDKSGL